METILRLAKINKILGQRQILQDCTLELKKGELKSIIGPSGAGKSTLLQCANCLIIPDSGEICLGERKINPQKREDLHFLRTKVGMIFQDFNLFDHLNAIENVSIALEKVHKVARKEARDRALQELARVGLDKQANFYPAQLSGGQKQRVAIARALAVDPSVLLLDEPTSALDPELVGEVLAVVQDLAKAGLTMLMVTHQMDFASACSNTIVFMEKGKIIEEGSPMDLLSKPSRTQDFFQHLQYRLEKISKKD